MRMACKQSHRRLPSCGNSPCARHHARRAAPLSPVIRAARKQQTPTVRQEKPLNTVNLSSSPLPCGHASDQDDLHWCQSDLRCVTTRSATSREHTVCRMLQH